MIEAATQYSEYADHFRRMMDLLVQQNPRVAARFADAVANPPKIGSVKLSWRDGKLNGIEVVEQTY